MKYFLSFVEEGIFNPKYQEYTAGRMEIWDDVSQYDIDEIRFFTKDKDFWKFREKWDFKEVEKKQLDIIIKILENKYYDREVLHNN